MFDFKAMCVFVTVVDQGSMQAAANKLQMTASSITQNIQKLESSLKITLLNRTTRKFSLTEAGEAFYQHASKMLQSAESAVKSVEILRNDTIGELNITCVTGLQDSLLIKAFKNIVEHYQDFHLNFWFEDRISDLLDQRIDIALRAGEGALQDNMIARHIYDFEWVIVAHKDYLRNKQFPHNLNELGMLEWVHFGHNRSMDIHLSKDNEMHVLQPKYRVVTNSLYSCRSLVMNGFGVSIQPIDDVQNEIANGELISLMPDWKIPSVPLYLITLQRIQSEKVRIVCDLITDYFKHLKRRNG